MFLSISLLLSNKRWKRWLANYATKSVRPAEAYQQTVTQAKKLPRIFSHHAFVIYDQSSNVVADWVDNFLLRNLCDQPPYFNLGVLGKEDQCGSSPLKQLLQRIEASRKVIVILSGNYANSNEGRYVIAALEHLVYETGQSKSIFVMFEQEVKLGRLLRRLQRANSACVLQVPDETDDIQIFWDLLRSNLKSA